MGASFDFRGRFSVSGREEGGKLKGLTADSIERRKGHRENGDGEQQNREFLGYLRRKRVWWGKEEAL